MGNLAGTKDATLTLLPEAPRTGVPITALFGKPPAGKIVVRPLSGQKMDAFSAVPSAAAGGWSIQFTVTEPGDYELSTGVETRPFRVEKQISLTFLWEFGVFVALAFIVVGGIIACVMQKKRKALPENAAGSF